MGGGAAVAAGGRRSAAAHRPGRVCARAPRRQQGPQCLRRTRGASGWCVCRACPTRAAASVWAFARRQAAGHAEGGRQHADNNVGCATSHHALARASRLKLCGGGGGLALCPTRSAPFAGGRTAACWYAVAAAPPPSALWPQRREGSAQAPWSAGTRARVQWRTSAEQWRFEEASGGSRCSAPAVGKRSTRATAGVTPYSAFLCGTTGARVRWRLPHEEGRRRWQPRCALSLSESQWEGRQSDWAPRPVEIESVVVGTGCWLARWAPAAAAAAGTSCPPL